MSGRHLGIFFQAMCLVFFQAKCLRGMFRCLGDTFGIFQGKCLRDMFRCLGDIFFTGKMPERHFKICGRHLVFFQQDV